MMELNFKYKKKNSIIKCNEDDYIKNVCNQFKNKLNLKRIFFIYEDQKINLELDMRVDELLQLDYHKKKKRYEIKVCDEPIQIKFGYLGKETYLQIKENEKIIDVLKRYANKTNKKFEEIYFLYGGEVINEETYNSTFDDFANDIDKKDNTISLIVNENDLDAISSKGTFNNNEVNDEEIQMPNNLRENMIVRNIDPQVLDQRKFYLKFLIILLIEYVTAAFFSWLGFFLKFNTLLIKDSNRMKKEIIPVIILLIVISVISNEILKKYPKGRYLMVYHVFSSLITIYFSFLLSKYFEPKYIITALSIMLTELVGLILYILLFSNYKYLFLALSSFILSLITMILFSILWIKELLPIIFISLFLILSIAFIILNIHIILKICKIDEFSYACIIFNYGLFLLIAFGLKYIYNIIKAEYDNCNEDVKLQIKIYSFFIIQNIIIISIISISFYYKWNYVVIQSWKSFKWFLIPTTIINFIICLVLFFLIFNWDENKSPEGSIILHALYIIFIIIYSFLLTAFIDPKFILGLLIILLLNLIAIELFIFLFNSTNLFGYFFSPVFMSIITIAIFHSLWLKNKNSIISNIIISFFFIIFWTVLSSVFKNEGLNSNVAHLAYNYGNFIFIYFLAIVILALALVIAIGTIALIIYILVQILKCYCGDSNQ